MTDSQSIHSPIHRFIDEASKQAITQPLRNQNRKTGLPTGNRHAIVSFHGEGFMTREFKESWRAYLYILTRILPDSIGRGPLTRAHFHRISRTDDRILLIAYFTYSIFSLHRSHGNTKGQWSKSLLSRNVVIFLEKVRKTYQSVRTQKRSPRTPYGFGTTRTLGTSHARSRQR